MARGAWGPRAMDRGRNPGGHGVRADRCALRSRTADPWTPCPVLCVRPIASPAKHLAHWSRPSVSAWEPCLASLEGDVVMP